MKRRGNLPVEVWERSGKKIMEGNSGDNSLYYLTQFIKRKTQEAGKRSKSK